MHGEEILTWFMGLPKTDYYKNTFINPQDINKVNLSSSFMRLLEQKFHEITKVAQELKKANPSSLII